jgi:excisionase family DNA binding protein
VSDLPLVLTVEEMAEVMRISRGSAYEAIRTGAVPHVRIGRTIRVPRKALLALLGEDETPTRRGDSTTDAARAPGTSASASSPVGAELEGGG